MQVEAFLADSVVAAEGKLYVQGGGWDTIRASSVPARHPRVGIAVLVHVPYSETNQPHRIELRLEDADGSEVPLGDAPDGVATSDGKVRRVGAPFVIGRPPDLPAGTDQIVPVAMNFDGLVFGAGCYRFVLAIDDADVQHLSFRVAIPTHVGPVVR